MIKRRYVDPFFPHRPVDDPDRFSGREDQVEEVVDSLFQLKGGNPRHSIITGDRGIGKSSLLLQAKLLAEGDNRLADRLGIDPGVEKFDFVVAWHDADPGQGPEELVEGLFHDLRSRARKFWNQIKIEVDLAGLKVSGHDRAKKSHLAELVRAFCTEAGRLSRRARENERDGLIFFVDELDRAAPDSGVATFFKLTTERLNREGHHHLAFSGAGITGAVQQLEKEHGSIFRTLRDIPLPRFTESETGEILAEGFDDVDVDYSQNIPKRVHNISGGFPEPVHLMGSEMLAVDDDDKITKRDFEKAKTKIITDVRRNKLQSVLRAAGSGKYQRILLAMAEHDAPDVPLEVISDALGLEQNQYSTNMRTLLDRDILSKVDRGVYTFVDPLLKEYIRHFGVISPDTGQDDEG